MSGGSGVRIAARYMSLCMYMQNDMHFEHMSSGM